MDFFLGFLSVLGCFLICYALCVSFMLLKNRFKKQAPPPEPTPEPPREEARVYYVSAPVKKQVKRKPRKPISIPLKATLPPKGTVVVADPKIINKKPKAKSAKKAQSTLTPSPHKRSR